MTPHTVGEDIILPNTKGITVGEDIILPKNEIQSQTKGGRLIASPTSLPYEPTLQASPANFICTSFLSVKAIVLPPNRILANIFYYFIIIVLVPYYMIVK